MTSAAGAGHAEGAGHAGPAQRAPRNRGQRGDVALADVVAAPPQPTSIRIRMTFRPHNLRASHAAGLGADARLRTARQPRSATDRQRSLVLPPAADLGGSRGPLHRVTAGGVAARGPPRTDDKRTLLRQRCFRYGATMRSVRCIRVDQMHPVRDSQPSPMQKVRYLSDSLPIESEAGPKRKT